MSVFYYLEYTNVQFGRISYESAAHYLTPTTDGNEMRRQCMIASPDEMMTTLLLGADG
ncbi:hypothetical protein NEUTE1DRAFT_140381 [Neurospora tetrasperma FGSC 2508]|uniref:Uncharacterized protein n=2 Tax=Neurospora TaxID=5140 RepID=A0AAJ0I8K9_9PEZI|nr:uncharacterized protein NEUTE1DRAFT_140381 [Neurospora tetrasperma FGSC 2508]EGO54036.1 hypothetical protein NEUTE1DRAFT_140381 [Neurospora tetrasperma FGSC 2508]KAK3492927.1 hypothetical protein B0T23DRAFT_404925 [Neurospora hispaniola]